MKTKLTLMSFALLMLLTTTTGFAQTQFWIDNMEGAAPSAGSRSLSVAEWGTGGPPNTRYFKRVTLTPPTTLNINAPGYNTASIQGTGFWAIEDNDGAGGGNVEQSITWSTTSISGMTGLIFRGLFATGGTAGWDHGTASTATDFARVEYNIDNTGWHTLIDFRPTNQNASNGNLAVDTDGNGVGDGTVLNTSFTEFSVNIPGTGANIQLRITVLSNSIAEEIAFDNISLLSGGTLPVSLTGFTGSTADGDNKLTWTTASEQGSSHFQVERSTDASHFEAIGRVSAAGTSSSIRNYSYLDNYAANRATYYYRLKQVDLDGSFTYSPIIVVRQNASTKVVVYPNPAITSTLQVALPKLASGRGTIRVMNTNGQEVLSKSYINSGYAIVIPLDVSILKAGRYLLQIIQSDFNSSQHFIKQ